jgi:hypothetical protein
MQSSKYLSKYSLRWFRTGVQRSDGCGGLDFAPIAVQVFRRGLRCSFILVLRYSEGLGRQHLIETKVNWDGNTYPGDRAEWRA